MIRLDPMAFVASARAHLGGEEAALAAAMFSAETGRRFIGAAEAAATLCMMVGRTERLAEAPFVGVEYGTDKATRLLTDDERALVSLGSTFGEFILHEVRVGGGELAVLGQRSETLFVQRWDGGAAATVLIDVGGARVIYHFGHRPAVGGVAGLFRYTPGAVRNTIAGVPLFVPLDASFASVLEGGSDKDEIGREH